MRYLLNVALPRCFAAVAIMMSNGCARQKTSPQLNSELSSGTTRDFRGVGYLVVRSARQAPVLAVGDRGTIVLITDGKPRDLLCPTTENLLGVGMPSSHYYGEGAVVVGAAGTLLDVSPDGKVTQRSGPNRSVSLRAATIGQARASRGPAQELVAVGDGGVVWRHNEMDGWKQDVVSSADLLDVQACHPSDGGPNPYFLAVGTNGSAFRIDGHAGAIAKVVVATSKSLSWIDHACDYFGGSGDYFRFNGETRADDCDANCAQNSSEVAAHKNVMKQSGTWAAYARDMRKEEVWFVGARGSFAHFALPK